jgi:OmpA family
MFHETGPGEVDVYADFSGVGVLKALLYNFDFDDFADLKYRALKVKHASFLADNVVPLLEDNRGNIWMQGSASRIGSNAWNMELSQTRVGRVANFLSTRGIASEQMQLDAVGEELAAKHADEDDPRDRSVTLWVYPRFELNTPLPRRVPPRPLVTRHFKIAMITGLSVFQATNIRNFLRGSKIKGGKLGGGLAIDGIIFMIWDWTNKISCLYLYFALGLGVGLSFTPKVSATTHGPWNPFTTDKPISCWQFGRWARFTTAGVWSKSVNWITLETPRGVSDIKSLPINTGTTLGAGASTAPLGGDFILLDQPRRFAGP